MHNPLILDKDWVVLAGMRAALLWSPIHSIPNTTGMHVYHYVPNIEEKDELRSVVIRPEDRSFWETCIAKSMAGHRVCGVGNPGTGKSATMFHLIRLLAIEYKRTVVYAIKTNRTVYMELKPVLDQDTGCVVDIEMCIHSIIPELIPCLQDQNAYYVVDPGKSKESCDVDADFSAHFIMAASCDNRHWGAGEFTKLRGKKTKGKFIYASHWEEASLFTVKRYIGLGHLEDQEISNRYRAVGGSVRAIQSYSEDEFKQDVENALSGITKEVAHSLADGTCQFTFMPLAPGSILVAITPRADNREVHSVVLASDLIEEMLAAKFLKLALYDVLDEENSGNRGNLFEAFVRRKLSTSSVQYEMCRQSLPTKPDKGPGNMKKNYQKVTSGKILGSKRTIVRVSDMYRRVKDKKDKGEMVYSKNEREPLVDMICRVDNGYEATQATIQVTHTVRTQQIRTLVDKLGLSATEHLTIVYAAPKSRYNAFATDPVNPILGFPELANIVTILHVAVDDE
ncbi:MAG: hypothetical protein SGILL_001537 [Bacillariaceae sp.]